MKMLKVSEDVSFPRDIVTQTIAILAKRRAGKSYTMRKLCEELLENDEQLIMVDPKGDQWGIRSSADGKKPGYPIVILGGEHGDVPLEVNAGEMVAKLVVEERVSILLDLSIFRKHEIATFMTAFLENLYRLKAKEEYRTPVMLVIDEADAIAPQKPQQNEARMLGAAEDIVRRGGQRGIGCALITQRSAVLNKNVLTQAQMLVVLRTIAPQDLAAMRSWIEVHGTMEEGKELMESLPSLPIGDAWFWSPGWPTEAGIFKRSHVLPIKTFDSGATPKPGEKKIVPRNLADINLDVLKKQMSETIEKAKGDDPKLLKKRILELENEKATMGKIGKVADPLALQKALEPHLTAFRSVENGYKVVVENWESYVDGVFHLIQEFTLAMREVHKNKPTKKPGASYVETPSPLQFHRGQLIVEKPVSEVKAWVGSTGDRSATLSKGAQSVLSYLESVFPKEKTKTQMWVATGYSPGGGFNNLIYELTGQNLIAKVGVKYQAMKSGGAFDTSLNKWYSKLTTGAGKILRLLIETPYDFMSKDDIAAQTGYAQGGGFNNLIYELTGAELIKKVGAGIYQINEEILDL